MEDPFLRIVRYTSAQKNLWDSFVPQTKNGTFLFSRDYMDYHADRFEDFSLLFYKGSKLIALLPGHKVGDLFGTHNGLSYGGFLLSYQATATVVLQLFSMLRNYLISEAGVSRIIYRTIPAVYHRYPSDEDLYALFRFNAQLIERKISSVIAMKNPLPFQKLRQRKLKQAQLSQLTLHSDSAFEPFWSILEANLYNRHDKTPVHSVEEMIRLQRSFPQEIKLFRVLNGVETVAGCVMYLTEEVAHVQYIATTDAGRKIGALDFLFDYLIHTEYKEKSYFDFGVSVEAGGRYLNEGLIFQKEGFGGRGIVYDTYELFLKSDSDDKVS